MKIKNASGKYFSLHDIIIISLCAGLGIVVKPLIVPLFHIITGPLFIPGGAMAGGLYFLFIVIATLLVNKPGTAAIACLLQAFIITVSGMPGSHGPLSLITYFIPGVVMEILLIFRRDRSRIGIIICFLLGIGANVSGTLLSNLVFFNLPVLPLSLALITAALSGGLGAIAAYAVAKRIKCLMPKNKTYIKEK